MDSATDGVDVDVGRAVHGGCVGCGDGSSLAGLRVDRVFLF